MTTRILPPGEWDRLPKDSYDAILPFVNADEMQVAVLEDDGRIIGTWAVLRIVHLEGLWLDPAYRGNPRAASQLLRETWTLAKQWARQWVMTAATDAPIRRLLTRHMGAVAIPGEMFVMPLEGAKRCRLLQ